MFLDLIVIHYRLGNMKVVSSYRHLEWRLYSEVHKVNAL
jgi:hypothetical protein